MRRLVLAIILAIAPAAGALSNDLADCAQRRNPRLKFEGCTQLAARDGKLAAAYNSRALALTALGESDRAIADYSHAISLDSTMSVAYYNRGLLYLEIGEPKLAAADFSQVIGQDARDATAFNGRAMANAADGDFGGAEADFARAIAIDPAYERAFLGRASMNLARLNYDSARADFDAVLRLHPDSEEAILGRSYAVEGAQPPSADVVASTSPLKTRSVRSSFIGQLESLKVPKQHHHRSTGGHPAALGVPSVKDMRSEDLPLCANEFGDMCIVLSR